MKEHRNVAHYKENYANIKRALNNHAAYFVEFLSWESKNISEKGLRNLIKEYGKVRRTVFSNIRKNKELHFKVCDAIEAQLKNIKSMAAKLKVDKQ